MCDTTCPGFFLQDKNRFVFCMFFVGFFLSHYVKSYTTEVGSHNTDALVYFCKSALVERIGSNVLSAS